MLTYDEALELVKKYVKNDKLIKHMIAVSAIMDKLAEKLGEDRELWKIVGLLHDIDYELTQKQPEKHGVVAVDILKNILPENALTAIKAHNELTGTIDNSRLAVALRAADAASGLIIAVALVMPNRKLDEVRIESLLKKFKQKDFARGVKRDRIMECEKLGLSLEEFLTLSLEALKEISNTLGL